MSFISKEKDPIPLETHAGPVIVFSNAQNMFISVSWLLVIALSVSRHISARGKAMNKLGRFLDKNKNAPFSVKKKFVDACFNHSLLYGCESWLEEKVSTELESFYMKGIKCLLNVRS